MPVTRHVKPAARWTVATAWLLLATTACARATATPLSVDDEEQRLLPGIVRQHEARVQQASKEVDGAHDVARSLRLRQRMLIEYGRDDLAAGLAQEAAGKELEEGKLRQKLTDEEDALRAYRDHAARMGVPLTSSAEPAKSASGGPAAGKPYGVHSIGTRGSGR